MFNSFPYNVEKLKPLLWPVVEEIGHIIVVPAAPRDGHEELLLAQEIFTMECQCLIEKAGGGLRLQSELNCV